ncbi:hypothetical protein PTTG_26922 [Puccinia triticina 1-1 BBBD Race 1]|uniref:Uncharacterized protein n=1 Tax=Puccinia triticina (isolate 1-1 / race 1 (BBBD)) TaxID=630390 RepID=A0A180GPT7_PUCT1|nr:hypothetical protein PTTG_26922 [Puccinia triticina 1-1 BBBD Race 1]
MPPRARRTGSRRRTTSPAPERPGRLSGPRPAPDAAAGRPGEPAVSWHAQTPIGSLPMAASLLAAPPPPPVDHSSFLAILPPGHTPNLPVPALTLVPPPASQLVEAPALTALSTHVEPALSRRVSLSSSSAAAAAAAAGTPPDASSAGQIEDHDPLPGFTFIRSPAKSSQADPSPRLSASWTEIVEGSPAPPSPIETSQVRTARPPLVANATGISLAQSCVAEHGSVGDLNDDEEEPVPQTPRKRKVTSLTAEPSPPSPNKEAEKEGERGADAAGDERQHKVPRAALDVPFSSSTTSQAVGPKSLSSTAHPLSFLALGGLVPPASLKARRSGSRKDRRKSPASSLQRAQSQKVKDGGGQRNRANSAAEVWNFSVVSTVVGVVLIAVVLIGSTNLSGINYNGKSWLGNWIKKVV